MAYDPHKHHRRSIRLKGYDYSQAGAYFITICVNHGRCFLGDVREGEMYPSPAGELEAIRTYIINNPANWDKDQLHPAGPPNKFNAKWKRPKM